MYFDRAKSQCTLVEFFNVTFRYSYMFKVNSNTGDRKEGVEYLPKKLLAQI